MAKGNRTTSKGRRANVAKVTKGDDTTDGRTIAANLLENINSRSLGVMGEGFYVKNAATLLNLLADSMGADTTLLQHSEGWGCVYFLAHALDLIGGNIAREGESISTLTFDVARHGGAK